MAVHENSEFISKIEGIRNAIERHHQTLNIEAIWLFLATLGCWSVNVKWLQIAAILIVFVLFFYKVYENRKGQKSSAKRLKEIKVEIEKSNLATDSKKARLFDISELQYELLSFKSIYKRMPQFLICYAFWGISLLYFTTVWDFMLT